MTMGANTSSKAPVFDENEDGKKCAKLACKQWNFVKLKYKHVASQEVEGGSTGYLRLGEERLAG